VERLKRAWSVERGAWGPAIRVLRSMFHDPRSTFYVPRSTFYVLRSTIILLPVVLHAAIWPDQFASFTKASSKPAEVADQAVWNEYGLQETERAEYISSEQRFTAAAYRFKDPTGALAAFQWQSPGDAKRSSIGEHAVQSPRVTLVAFHNYLFRFEGRRPDVEELTPVLGRLARLDQSPLPALPGFLPAQGLIPNSERYVLGPASLAAFEPRLSPSLAAFHLGSEAQLGKYKTQSGEMALAIFTFPTPALARDRVAEFSKLPGAVVKRSGPLVAVILSPADKDAAERLLAQVNYEVNVSWTEYAPSARDNVGNLILGIFRLTGLLLLFCLGAGLVFGGLTVLRRRIFKKWGIDESMIVLHLDDR